MSKPLPLLVRLLAKIDTSPGLAGDECWLWRASTSRRFGYGRIREAGRGSRLLVAHRLVYELVYGPIPEGLEVGHKCDRPLCCRPDHLFLCTHQENMADYAAKFGGICRSKTGFTDAVPF